MGLERIRVVLVRPRHPGNVGAAARALKNMGLERLVLVAPARWRDDAPLPMAVHAADVVARATTAATLAAAVADCGLVVGTRGPRTGDSSETVAGADATCEASAPHVVAAEMLAASRRNDVALLFGPEDHGLTNDDLALCQRVLTIPTAPAYGSLNLAQAVAICAYELLLAAASPLAPAERVVAPSEQTELMYARLEAALAAIGYLRPESARHMMHTLRRMLGRAGLDEREVRILLGIARQMAWAAEQIRRAAPPRRAAGA